MEVIRISIDTDSSCLRIKATLTRYTFCPFGCVIEGSTVLFLPIYANLNKEMIKFISFIIVFRVELLCLNFGIIFNILRHGTILKTTIVIIFYIPTVNF